MRLKKILLKVFTDRTIQVHILTIVLFLIITSCFVITRYTYRKYYEDIDLLSDSTIDQANELLSEKVSSIKNEVQLILETIKGSLHTKEEMIGEDLRYTGFLINILRNDPILTGITIATPQGDYFAVMNAHLESSSGFYSHLPQKLQEEVRYIVRIIHQVGDSSNEVWKYLNEEGSVLNVEAIAPASYDFRKDPWVLEMEKEQGLYWASELLPRGVLKHKGQRFYAITASDVVKDLKGDVLSILSVGVTLKNLSEFILNQKIGKTGSAFILNPKGEIKVPVFYGVDESDVLKTRLIKAAYQEFSENKKNSFSFVQNDEKYLFSIQESFVFGNDRWFIAIIIPFNDFFGEIVKTQNKTRFLSFWVIVISAIASYFCVKYISKPVVRMATEVDRIRGFDFSEVQYIKSQIREIADLESSIRSMRSALRSFSRYVPKEIVKNLVKYGGDVDLGGERLEITIMFSDIENFTTISESLPIEELMRVLSEYFDVISKIILQDAGTIDKYIGDSVMSFWGAPLKIEDHSEKACLAALHSLAAIKKQGKWVTRFGIHTGETIVGNIGTAERLNYTVMGDAVNVAARLQTINKEYHTSIMISDVVCQKIGSKFVTRPIDFVAVKGKMKKIKIFELMGMTEGALSVSAEQIELSKLFTQAYDRLEEGAVKEAYELFLGIQKRFPLDGPTKKHLERLAKIEQG